MLILIPKLFIMLYLHDLLVLRSIYSAMWRFPMSIILISFFGMSNNIFFLLNWIKLEIILWWSWCGIPMEFAGIYRDLCKFYISNLTQNKFALMIILRILRCYTIFPFWRIHMRRFAELSKFRENHWINLYYANLKFV